MSNKQTPAQKEAYIVWAEALSKVYATQMFPAGATVGDLIELRAVEAKAFEALKAVY